MLKRKEKYKLSLKTLEIEYIKFDMNIIIIEKLLKNLSMWDINKIFPDTLCRKTYLETHLIQNAFLYLFVKIFLYANQSCSFF